MERSTQTSLFFIIMSLSWLLTTSCSNKSSSFITTTEKDSITPPDVTPPTLPVFEISYGDSPLTVKVGDDFVIAPSSSTSDSFYCDQLDSDSERRLQRLGAHFSHESCTFQGAFFRKLESLDISVTAHSGEHSYQTTVTIKAKRISAEDFDQPGNPAHISKYYMSTLLASDPRNYMATFDATSIHFFDIINPFVPHIIGNTHIFSTASGMPQALTSVGDYVYVVTSTGVLHIFNWSERSAPTLVKTHKLPVTHQMYDIATDGDHLLFIANTVHQRLLVVDVSAPESPDTVYVSDPLGGLGSGVAYYNGYVYISNHSQSKIHVFHQPDETQNWQQVQEFPTVNRPARLTVNSTGSLISHEYNNSDLHIYDLNYDPAKPELSNQLSTGYGINIYSRSFTVGDLLITGSRSRAQLDIFRKNQQGQYRIMGHTTIEGDDFTGSSILGIMSFRNQSMVSTIVSNHSDGNKRQIVHLSIDDILDNLVPVKD